MVAAEEREDIIFVHCSILLLADRSALLVSGVILADSHAPVPRVVAPDAYFRFPSATSCFRIMQT
jgi:hypothetical protein